LEIIIQAGFEIVPAQQTQEIETQSPVEQSVILLVPIPEQAPVARIRTRMDMVVVEKILQRVVVFVI
jgi:hypothetical protein